MTLDPTEHQSGDTKIFGVKMQYEPHNIPAGYAAAAVNMRFNKGTPETRRGAVFLGWANQSDDVNIYTDPEGVIHYIDPETGGRFLDPEPAT